MVWLWNPFHRHVVNIRRRCMWDSRASIINAFATFLLLSYSKILFVSFTLLYVVYNHYLDVKIPKCFLYYDQTVDCDSYEYTIFATLAICVLTIFIFSPLLLLILYPTRLFRRCIMFCGSRTWNALRTFVEAFQGEYKDGTNGTCDLRIFSALFFSLRILILLSYLEHQYKTKGPLLLSQGVVFVSLSCLITIARPHKATHRNIIDSLVLAFLGLLFLLLASALYIPHNKENHHLIIAMIFVGTPHAVLLSYICNKLVEKIGIVQFLINNYRNLKQLELFIRHAPHDPETDVERELFPDRLHNPENYGPDAQEHTTSEPLQSKEATREPRRLTPVYTYGSIN